MWVRPRCCSHVYVLRLQSIHSRIHFNLLFVDENKVYTWGLSNSGQLGHGDLKAKLAVTRVKELDSHCIVDVVCGSFRTTFLSSNKTLFSLVVFVHLHNNHV